MGIKLLGYLFFVSNLSFSQNCDLQCNFNSGDNWTLQATLLDMGMTSVKANEELIELGIENTSVEIVSGECRYYLSISNNIRAQDLEFEKTYWFTIKLIYLSDSKPFYYVESIKN